jgi:hypothetical protein
MLLLAFCVLCAGRGCGDQKRRDPPMPIRNRFRAQLDLPGFIVVWHDGPSNQVNDLVLGLTMEQILGESAGDHGQRSPTRLALNGNRT